jgi:hypothetical protein
VTIWQSVGFMLLLLLLLLVEHCWQGLLWHQGLQEA